MRKLSWLILLVLLLACGHKAEPDNLISRDKMEDILWDLMRADLFITNYMVIKDPNLDKKQQGIELYTRILKLHNVSQEQFRSSFTYYRSQPEELKVLMDSISHRSDTAYKHLPTKPPVLDTMNAPANGKSVKTDTGRKTKFQPVKGE